MDLLAVVQTVGLSGLALAGFVWLAKSVIAQALSADLAAHKAALEAQNAISIEELKGRLQVAATEHAIRFTTLHQRQADIIAKVYELLDDLHLAFRRWAAFMRPADADMAELQAKTGVSFQAFVDYYHPHAIWLDRDTCDKINDIVNDMNKSFIGLSFDLDKNGFPTDRDAWKAAYDRINGKVPEARQSLEARFRSILGVGEANE